MKSWHLCLCLQTGIVNRYFQETLPSEQSLTEYLPPDIFIFPFDSIVIITIATTIPGEKVVCGEHFVTFGTLECLVPVDSLDVACDVGLSERLAAVVTDDFFQALFLFWPLLDRMVLHVVLPEQSPLLECCRAVATPLHEDAIVNFLNMQSAKHKTTLVVGLYIWSTFRKDVLVHSRPSKWQILKYPLRRHILHGYCLIRLA